MEMCTSCGESAAKCETFPIRCACVTTWAPKGSHDDRRTQIRIRPDESKWVVLLCPSCVKKTYTDFLSKKWKRSVKVLEIGVIMFFMLGLGSFGLAQRNTAVSYDKYSIAAVGVMSIAAGFFSVVGACMAVGSLVNMIVTTIRRRNFAGSGEVIRKLKRKVFLHFAENIRDALVKQMKPAVHGQYELPRSESNQTVLNRDSLCLVRTEWIVEPDENRIRDDKLLQEYLLGMPLPVLSELAAQPENQRTLSFALSDMRAEDILNLLNMTTSTDDSRWQVLHGAIERNAKSTTKICRILTMANLTTCALAMLNIRLCSEALLALVGIACCVFFIGSIMLSVTGSMYVAQYKKVFPVRIAEARWIRKHTFWVIACWFTLIASVTFLIVSVIQFRKVIGH